MVPRNTRYQVGQYFRFLGTRRGLLWCGMVLLPSTLSRIVNVQTSLMSRGRVVAVFFLAIRGDHIK